MTTDTSTLRPSWLDSIGGDTPPTNEHLVEALRQFLEHAETVTGLIAESEDIDREDSQRLARMLWHQVREMQSFFEGWIAGDLMR